MFKNVASQRWIVFAFEDGGGTTPGAPKTGDAANITAKISKDGAAAGATNDTNPTEIEDGKYQFDLTQAETNADELVLFPESSTANIQVVAWPQVIYTRPSNFGDLGIEADGHVHADVKEWLGTAVTLGSGAPDVNIQSTDDIDLSATQKASVNAEADSAIETYGLDHLLAAAVAGTDVTDDSIIAQLVSASATADWDDFVNTTDALQALRDHIGDGTSLTEAGGDGDHLTEAGGTGDHLTALPESPADVTKISGDATAADRLEALMDGLIVAQVNDASATTTAFAADGFTEATDDHFNGRLITFITGDLAGQQTDITDYDAAGGAQGSQEFTVTALTSAPADGDFFVIH